MLAPSSAVAALSQWSEEGRLVAAIRFVLAASALAVTWIDPSQPAYNAGETYLVLVCYTGYSAILYRLVAAGTASVRIVEAWGHWIDFAWYAALNTLSGGPGSIFFVGLFFPIMSGSFLHGLRSGLAMTGAVGTLIAVMAFTVEPPPGGIELNRLLLRPMYLLVLGAVVARWGGVEITLKRRLALLRDVTALSNPRFGIDRTIGNILERVRAYYDADTCVLVAIDADARGASQRRALRGHATVDAEAESMSSSRAAVLLAPADDLAVVYGSRIDRRPWTALGMTTDRVAAYDVAGRRQPIDTETARQLDEAAAALEAARFASVPLPADRAVRGRLYITSARASFDEATVTFLRQILDHVAPLLDSVRLVEHLAASATTEARRRLARDIHDSVIQPIVGLRMGLAALRERLQRTARSDADVDRLVAMADTGMGELRRYLQTLRESDENVRELLVPAVRNVAAAFADTTGIRVDVEADEELRVSQQLADEALRMVAESLSNVRRHTDATAVTLRLGTDGQRFVLQAANTTARADLAHFLPHSIAERATALGGIARVVPYEEGRTIVTITVPL